MKIMLAGMLLAAILGALGFLLGRTFAPRSADARVTVEEPLDCTWGEVKQCQGGGHNRCCPKDK